MARKIKYNSITLPKKGDVFFINGKRYLVASVVDKTTTDKFIYDCSVVSTDAQLAITLTSKYPFKTECE